ncbi:MAG: DNA-binding response regulator [Bacteroidetes bacterium GWF2_38_335]|nr:MAG: DNA-binding response regulator [Bacteroidetes bacterium GWF2_38_335]OFY80810.1 MAG: DNA-binding response regulator [Bacteroidetes bacterium RIFOXYA12_FULL_38_20]HBS86210.1 DNA-binding response regulator [Bacteroidales bacterium]
MSKLNIILVDDHSLFRNGLKLLLKSLGVAENIYEAGNGREFLEIIRHEKVDIALMDISMPVMDGIEATDIAMAEKPDFKIIALTMFGEEEYYLKMINAGVKGFLLKDSDIKIVTTAIEEVMKGNNYFSQEILLKLVVHKEKMQKEPELLSEREIEVLTLICKGMSNQEIADKLFVSKRTVDKHRENLLGKTQSKNTASLIMYAMKNGIISS